MSAIIAVQSCVGVARPDPEFSPTSSAPSHLATDKTKGEINVMLQTARKSFLLSLYDAINRSMKMEIIS